MAKKKSKATQASSWTTIFWTLVTCISGGGIGGYCKPDLPVLGPLVKNLKEGLESWQTAEKVTSATAPGSSEPINIVQAEGGVPVTNAPDIIRTQLTATQRPGDKLRIATFNIQVFGESKLAKAEVVSVLVQIVRQFDIVAIQEIRSKSDDVMARFLAAINSDGSRYNFLIGPRLGRTNSTEQYAFIYDTNRVEHDPSSVSTIQDPKDLLHREPFMARFRPRTNSPENAFSFWLVDIHTDPDEVPQEIAALADVFQVMQSARVDEDDVIILGDLNASEFQLGKLGQLPGIRWVVSGAMTNTLQNKAYDNLVFDGQATSEYTGRWGIVNFEKEFGLTREQALRVSDHFPVWADFQIWEAPRNGNIANRNEEIRR